MLSYDFIDAACKAYQFAFENARYLLRVALPVIFVKFTCLLAIYVLGAQSAHLLQGIIRLPGVALEAFFVIGLIRYFHYYEPIFTWGKLVTPAVNKHKPYPLHGPYTIKQSYLGGILIYILISLTQLAFIGLALDNLPIPNGQTPEQTPSEMNPLLNAFMFFAMIAAIVWAFRLLWLHISVAIGVPVGTFLKCAKGITSSTTLILTWMLCVMPLMIIAGMFIELSHSIFPEQSPAQIILSYLVETCFEIIIIAVQTLGLTIGMRQIIFGKEQRP